MKWELNIKKVENGYLLETIEEEIFSNTIFEIGDNGEELFEEQKTMRRVLYFIKDFFGVYNDKHANNGKGQYLDIKVSGDE